MSSGTMLMFAVNFVLFGLNVLLVLKAYEVVNRVKDMLLLMFEWLEDLHQASEGKHNEE